MDTIFLADGLGVGRGPLIQEVGVFRVMMGERAANFDKDAWRHAWCHFHFEDMTTAVFFTKRREDAPQHARTGLFLDALEDVPKKHKTGVGKDDAQQIVKTALKILRLVHKQPLDTLQFGDTDLIPDLWVGDIVLTDPCFDKFTTTLVVRFVEIGTPETMGECVDQRIKRADHGTTLDPRGADAPNEFVLDTYVKGAHAHIFDGANPFPPKGEKETEHQGGLAIAKNALNHDFVRGGGRSGQGMAENGHDLGLFGMPRKRFEPGELCQTLLGQLFCFESDPTSTLPEF